MATKSKKSKKYLKRWKVLAAAVFFIGAAVLFFCGVVTINISKNWHMDAMTASTVYDTQEFSEQFDTILNAAVLAEIQYQNEERILNGEAVNRKDLIEDFKRYYGIADGIITSNTEINDTYDGLVVHGKIPVSQQENLEEYRNLIETSLPQYYNMYLQRQVDEYRSCLRMLEETKNFLYYAEDENGIIVGGNTTKSDFAKMERTLVLSAGFGSDRLQSKKRYFSVYDNPALLNSDYKVYSAIREPMVAGDVFYALGQEFGFINQSLPLLFGMSLAAVLCMLGSSIYLMRVAGQKERGGGISYRFPDSIYNEIHFLLIAALAMAWSMSAGTTLDAIRNNGAVFWNYVLVTLMGILYLVLTAVGLSYLLSVARQVKGGIFFRNTWISVSIRRLGAMLTDKTFCGWMVFVMLCYGLGNCVIMGMLVLAPYYEYQEMAPFAAVVLVLFNALCMYLFLRALRSLKHIMISARESAKGDLSYALDLNRISPSFLNFAQDVANIQDGLKNAVDAAVKGERMKTELITNVSHDLKTPLTSIITYVDLLRQEELSNERASGYVEVLHDKSYRLKQLIEDLIEASKASSGNLTVNRDRLEYRQLVLQAIGEMEEKTQARGLTFRISCEEPVFIYADGRHMWRILENLLSNVIKYSLENGRVYVDIFAAEGYGVLVMKNISAEAIDFEASRLTERFVRGDVSRTTEGAGLGLSITQSLAQIQGGTFGIEVDGDLFKATVKIPLWTEETAEEMEE